MQRGYKFNFTKWRNIQNGLHNTNKIFRTKFIAFPIDINIFFSFCRMKNIYPRSLRDLRYYLKILKGFHSARYPLKRIFLNQITEEKICLRFDFKFQKTAVQADFSQLGPSNSYKKLLSCWNIVFNSFCNYWIRFQCWFLHPIFFFALGLFLL